MSYCTSNPDCAFKMIVPANDKLRIAIEAGVLTITGRVSAVIVGRKALERVEIKHQGYEFDLNDFPECKQSSGLD